MKEMKFQTMDDFEKELYNFKILFAYHSGKIENDKITYHNTRDIFDSGCVVGFTGDLKTLYEIENQKKCYEFLKPYILKKQKIDIDFIKKVHYKLARGTYDEYLYNVKGERAGEFKKHDYVTGKNEVGSYPHEVEQDLKELLKEINNPEIDDYFLAGTYFHAVFEHIHPFADANGRVGRTLMNYYFMIHDIAPTIIYNEDKEYYYKALEEFDDKETLNPLLNFVEEQQKKTWSHRVKERMRTLSYLQMQAQNTVKEKNRVKKTKNKDISK